jgi:predicted nucleic acid-binding protein
MREKSHADTSWIIALINREDPNHRQAVKEIDQLTYPPSISSLTLTELYHHFRGSDSLQFTTALATLKEGVRRIVDLTPEIAIRAGEIQVAEKIGLEEAIVLASALAEHSQLLTFDKKMKAVHERIK